MKTFEKIIIDRPLGSCHPSFPDLIYPLNYGYIPEVFAGDGKEQDVYLMGVHTPVEHFGPVKLVAIIHRLDDIEDKYVVAPLDQKFTEEEIDKAIDFQEHYFNTKTEVVEH